MGNPVEKEVWYDEDIASRELEHKTIAIIGYGAQGRSHALNLRDSGLKVIVGQRPGKRFDVAVADGFSPVPVRQAVVAADLIALMLPDEQHGTVFEIEIRPALKSGSTILVCHGFSLLYQQVVPPAGISAVLVAPKGAGHMVRTAYEQGSGVACLVAMGPGANEASHLPIALEYARGLGGGRAGILRTTIAEETETDLFGEQVVLCGGVSHLAAAAFQTLVDAGYRPEIAYFECIHELKLVVDLLYQGGLAWMRDHISNTAEFGDYSRGPRVIDDHVREQMKKVLEEIRSGQFAREWIAESASGGKQMNAWRSRHRQSAAELAGEKVRAILNHKPRR
jgi:ketol-acid reductoisomerase